MQVTDLRPNPSNPRLIKDKAFYSLVKKVLSLPGGLSANRIAYVTDGVKHKGKFVKGCFVLSGNQRHRALAYIATTELSKIEEEIKDKTFWQEFKKVKTLSALWQEFQKSKTLPDAWVQDVTNLNEAERQKLVIVTNVNDGYWDYDALNEGWEYEELKDWGVDINFKIEDIDLDQFFADAEARAAQAASEATNKIVLEYSAEDYQLVMDAFKQHKGSKEQVVFKLLGL